MKKNKTRKELLLEVETLKAQLAEAVDILRAIRSGEVDALVVSGNKGEQVFTLAGAEQPYRIIIEEMREGAVMLAANDSILYCNSGFASMLKMPLERLMGTGIVHYIAPADESVFRELLRQGRKRSSRGEIVLLARDGTCIPTNLSLNTLQLDDTQYVYLVATDLTEQKRIQGELRRTRDEFEKRVKERTAELVKANVAFQAKITERKQMEEELGESEKRYSSLFENMMDGFAYCKMLFDDDGSPADFVYLEVNGAFGWLTGLENVVGKKVTEVIPGIKESNPELFEIYGRVALTGQPEIFEIDLKQLGVWLSISVYSPEREYFVAVFDIITERKRAEEALRKAYEALEARVLERTAELKEVNTSLQVEIAQHKRAEQRISEQAALLDKAHDAIAVRDLEHRLIYWNNGAQRLYGWTTKEALGKNADELLYKGKNPRLIEAENFVMWKGEWTGELGQITKEGNKIIVQSRWTLVRDSEDKPKSILIINTDITDIKNLEKQLLQSQKMESIGTLAGGIAHDLNNMLTPMMLSVQILKEKFKDEQSQKLLTILEKNSRRGADMIKQVLLFSRGFEGERTPIQVKQLIFEIETIAKETFPENIEIRTDIQQDLFTTSGDFTQLHQVLVNLCINARDAMPNGGILGICAENVFIDEKQKRKLTEAKVGSYVAIAVSDTGIGIPEKILERIFEPFFTTKVFGKGTGLGLSIAHAIVKSHGGFIKVYSEPGKGTTFRVYLPATLAEIQQRERQQPELFIGQKELVLVVEDDDSILEVSVLTLEEYGYNVLAANDGADAVALYAQNKDLIKVVLIDMMMPGMDGHTAIKAIQKINPGVKIIAVSGLEQKDERSQSADIGVYAFLPKPYTAEKLLKIIHEVLCGK